MMSPIVLKNYEESGVPLQATFLPEKGMNLVSYKRGETEIIDQNTYSFFEERFAGLGSLIGPHFHRRSLEILPLIQDTSLFPHISRVKEKGIQDPFSHGIGRYAPWNIKTAEITENKVVATLQGEDLWNGVTLKSLEGQNFKMQINAELKPNGLSLDLSVVSDTDSLVGIHYYYYLPQKRAIVTSRVQRKWKNQLLDNSGIVLNEEQEMVYETSQPIDATFHPFPNPLQGKIHLNAIDYKLVTTYSSKSQENSWILWHPKDASFICIEPISAQDPRHPNLSVSSLNIHLQILP